MEHTDKKSNLQDSDSKSQISTDAPKAAPQEVPSSSPIQPQQPKETEEDDDSQAFFSAVWKSTKQLTSKTVSAVKSFDCLFSLLFP